MATEGKTKMNCKPTNHTPLKIALQFRLYHFNSVVTSEGIGQAVDDMTICEPVQPPFEYSSHIFLPIKVTPCVSAYTIYAATFLICSFRFDKFIDFDFIVPVPVDGKGTSWYNIVLWSSKSSACCNAACHWFHKVIEWHLRNFPLIFFFIEKLQF